MKATSALSRDFDKLPLGLKLGYASGQLVDGVATHAVNIFLLFYLTAVCGLPGGLAGAALSVGLVADALLDPLIGSLSDSWHSRFGRRLPFMLAGAPMVALAFVLIFSLPRELSGTVLFLWVAVLSMVLRVSMSLFILPYQTVGAEITDHLRERSGLVAWRWGIGMVGTLIAVMLGFGVFFAGPDGLTRREAYTPFALMLAAITLAGAAVSMWAVKATLVRQHAAPAGAGPSPARLWRELREVFGNRSFRILFVGSLLFFLALGIHGSLGLHANTFFWRLTTAQTQSVTLALFAGMVVGAPLAAPLLARLEKRSVLVLGLVGLAVEQGGPAALRLGGGLGIDGAPLVAVLSCVVFVGGVLIAAAAIAFGSMMADAADEHEHLFGARREGLYFAAWAFATKAAAGGGTLIAGLVLQVVAFPSDVAKIGGMAAAVPEHAIAMLGFFYGPGSALLTLAAIMTTLFYRLDSHAHAAILVDLNARRTGACGRADVEPISRSGWALTD